MTSPAAIPIAIYRDHLLSPSETFVLTQSEALRRHTAHYFGSRRIPGLELPLARTFAVNTGGSAGLAREAAFRFLGRSSALEAALRRVAPRLVHAHFGFSGTTILPMAERLQLPLVVTFWGVDATVPDETLARGPWSYRLYLRRRERLQRRAALFLTVCDSIRQHLLARGFPAERVLTHYNAVDTQRFTADPAVTRSPTVLFVGRLVEKKGVRYLIEAMARVQQDEPAAELAVIGGGPLEASLKAQAAASLRHVTFAGWQTPEQVRQWMNRAAVLVAPSVTAADGDAEGLPTTVLEAQAMELPVVGTRHAGITEAVRDEQTGFLVAERDAAGLATAIRRLLQDPALWKRMSLAARAHVGESFDLRRQTDRLEGLYDGVMAAAR